MAAASALLKAHLLHHRVPSNAELHGSCRGRSGITAGFLSAFLRFLNVLLARAAPVVEGGDAVGRAREIADDELDAPVQLARVPFDFGSDVARLALSDMRCTRSKPDAPIIVQGGCPSHTGSVRKAMRISTSEARHTRVKCPYLPPSKRRQEHREPLAYVCHSSFQSTARFQAGWQAGKLFAQPFCCGA